MVRWLHCIRVVLVAGVTLLPLAASGQPSQPTQATPAAPAASAAPATGHFLIFLRSNQIGTEDSTVTRTPEGWTISGQGRIGPPLDIVTRALEIKYDAQWKPLEMYIDATARNLATKVRTVVKGTTARNEITTIGEPAEKVDEIAADAVLLPNPFFAPFEALAARLRTATKDSTIALYTAPQGTAVVTVIDAAPEKIQTAGRLIEVRRSNIRLQPQAGPPVDAEVWADENGRLLRVTVPAQTLDVMRDDIAAVSTRRVAASRPNDEQIRITANGFSLAGTVSKPAATSAGLRLPAVVLVGGSGPTDRDETAFGIPIFGQISNTLADAGFLVLRYDKRGVGQSGGRPESVTLADYAEDLRAALKYLGDRKDVDEKRIAVLGHSEGGAVAMLAASKDNRAKALVLVSTIGVTGAELNMAQVTHAMARSTRPETEKQQTLDLQRRIQTAVTTGQGWENIPPQIRKQADVPWFQSFLTYDPAKTMEHVRRPMLIVQGELDTQVAPTNADRLEQLAKARKRPSPVEIVKVPGVNHLLVPAKTGEVDEYSSLAGATVSPAVTTPIVEWLKKTFVATK